MMFRGRSKHNLDNKGRLAIPARFKDALEQTGDLTLVVTNHDSCLWAYTKDQWRILEEKAAALPDFSDAAVAYFRYFISGASECPIKQGRITLPPDLRDIAGLQKEVVLVGQLKRFEIWDREKWVKEFERVREAYPKIRKELSELGA